MANGDGPFVNFDLVVINLALLTVCELFLFLFLFLFIFLWSKNLIKTWKGKITSILSYNQR